jgi:hypothetical protein
LDPTTSVFNMSKTRDIFVKFRSTLFNRGICLRRSNITKIDELRQGKPTQCAQLPNELWVVVIDFVDRRKDLYQLCRTSRFLRSIAEPKLYERHFRHSKRASKMDTRSIVLHPRLENIVNTVFLQLTPWSFESGRWVCCYNTLLDALEPICPCDRLDEALGRVLSGLFNLRALRISCQSCKMTRTRGHRYERHRYLATLQTKVLQEVNIDCTCSDMDEKKLVEYLGAPSMIPVTTLGWCTWGQGPTNRYLKESLTNLNILPNLRTLFYVRNDVNDLLLRYRSIQRISASSTAQCNAPTYEELTKRHRSLTHISIQVYGNAITLMTAIATNPFPFQNLQHLGRFHLRADTCLVRVISKSLVNLTEFEGSIQ